MVWQNLYSPNLISGHSTGWDIVSRSLIVFCGLLGRNIPVDGSGHLRGRGQFQFISGLPFPVERAGGEGKIMRNAKVVHQSPDLDGQLGRLAGVQNSGETGYEKKKRGPNSRLFFLSFNARWNVGLIYF